MNYFVISLFTLFMLLGNAVCLNCYIDTKGISEPDDEGIVAAVVVDKSKFKKFQCNVLKTEKEKVTSTFEASILISSPFNRRILDSKVR